MILFTSITTSGCAFLHIIYPPAFTAKQCEKVEQNFEKLKEGMTKDEVIPLICGKRRVSVTFPKGKFPEEQLDDFMNEQKEPWEVWALCSNTDNPYEWFMIAFGTETNKVVKVFSGSYERYGFD